MRRVVLAAAQFLVCLPVSAVGQSTAVEAQEVIVEIRVHGNTATPDDEILQSAGLAVSAPVTADSLAKAADRLRATKRFQRVDVLKRYASIADPSRIMVVILVDEGPVRLVINPLPGQIPQIVRRRESGLMILPLLDGEDGYGLRYGARFSFVNVAGKDSRVSFPVTWGGDKRAAAEFEKEFTRGLVSRVTGGVAVQRRTHPFYDQDANRQLVWGRIERNLTKPLRVGGGIGWQRVSFLHETLRVPSLGADVVLDTRLDPMLPRHAVYARAAIDRLSFDNAPLVQTRLDARWYLGLMGRTVLVTRALREDASGPAPAYFKSILGGDNNLRGFRAGTAVGDTLVAGSVELRIPLSSPLRVGRFGVSVFVDRGTTYEKGERLRDQRLETGIGGGVWFSATVVRLTVAVAHGRGASTRMHFAGGFFF